jgi:hypothetical protein
MTVKTSAKIGVKQGLSQEYKNPKIDPMYNCF